jgi:hypothetical protein
MNDPIVEEIRKYRQEYAAKFNYDLAAICRDLQQRQTTCGREVVSRRAKKVPRRQQAEIQTDHVTKR